MCGAAESCRCVPIRGDGARYCSDACRAAASRERTETAHRAALADAEARAYARGRAAGYAEGRAEALRAQEGRTGARTATAPVAGEQYLPGMGAAPAGAGMSRQQRRAAERAARKSGGVR
ncbi:hypothetical protein GCM10023353_39360 [Tomitella cavernea]|uniref:Uncharacterized protein n=1 Tax=Tomitella cavernea TaxID=1387982 RepID=A0ABP9D4K5_9ACTN